MGTSKLVAIFLVISICITNVVSYSKYGRTCQDIGCRSDETCVMAEDPCSYTQRDSCGRYPTCQRSGSGGESCTTKICPSGQYCKTENGRPTCVNTNPNLAFDSAGVSSVNGQRLNNQPAVPADPSSGSRYANSNPYANANAPPAEAVNNQEHNYPSRLYPQLPSANGDGYPPYPTQNNNYPPNPSQNNNYPPYPVQPKPGVPVDRYGYPIYPPSHNSPENTRYANNHNQQPYNPSWGTIPKGIFGKGAASSFENSLSMLIGTIAISLGVFRF